MKMNLMPIFKHSTGLTHNESLHLSLWTLQCILALFFGFVGYLKMATPIVELNDTMVWTRYVSGSMVRLIGAFEMLGALGLILPALAHRETYLVPLAAMGLTTIMVLAVGFHLMLGQMQMVGTPIILGLVTLFVAWGRYYPEPLEPVH